MGQQALLARQGQQELPDLRDQQALREVLELPVVVVVKVQQEQPVLQDYVVITDQREVPERPGK